MITVPIELTRELESRVATICHLFEFGFSKIRYWTDFSEDIFYSSQWYSRKGIRFDRVSGTAMPRVDSVNLEIDNVDKEMSDLILSEEIRRKSVTIRMASLDRNNNVVSSYILFQGLFDGIEVNQKIARVEVHNHLIEWEVPTPRRMHSATCPWVFQDRSDIVLGTDSFPYVCISEHHGTSTNVPITGATYATFWSTSTGSSTEAITWVSQRLYDIGTCRYNGASTWCDFSWDRCLTLSNTTNFGGFRWLSYIVDKKIWWGKTATLHPK